MVLNSKGYRLSLFVLFSAVIFTSCAVSPVKSSNGQAQHRTAFMLGGVSKLYYDGEFNDLAYGGLGLDAIRNGEAPVVSDPLRPSISDLRRLAIYHNIRSLSAMSDNAGYGSLYANFDLAASPVSGYEFIAPLLFDDGQVASVFMLQVPDNFDWDHPCLISAASSASRGIYGAIGVVGLWGLDKGCAVVHSDKGTGTGFYWLSDDQTVDVSGQINKPNENSHFIVDNVKQFAQAYPNRVATKHAHSQRNVGRHWGGAVLSSIEYAFELLNSEFGGQKRLTPENTLVIGAGISNGGGAVVVAAEQDKSQFFDGIVLAAPNIPVPAGYEYQYKSGEARSRRAAQETRSHRVTVLVEVGFNLALYLPCAALFSGEPTHPEGLNAHWQALLETRCNKLKAAGLLSGKSFREQSFESLQVLIRRGYPESANTMATTFARNLLWNSLMLSYTSDLGGYGVGDHLCDYSYAYANSEGEPIVTPDEVKALVFGRTRGSLPALGIQIMNDASADGPRDLMHSVDADGVLDLGFDNVMCMEKHLFSKRVQDGLTAIQASGNLQGLPAIIVHGEADNIIQVRNTSRAYAVLNSEVEDNSSLVYYEVKNAQHIDRLIDYPPYKTQYIPLQFYFEEALDSMYEHLTEGTAIPASREILTVPATEKEEKLTRKNLPSITSGNTNPIEIKSGVLVFAN